MPHVSQRRRDVGHPRINGDRICRTSTVFHFDGYDPAAGSPYLTNSTIPGFITYDGVASTTNKVRYVKSRGFGGVFMWELSADYDGTSQDLLSAMYQAWKVSRLCHRINRESVGFVILSGAGRALCALPAESKDPFQRGRAEVTPGNL